jgi:Transposase DDE domain group 1
MAPSTLGTFLRSFSFGHIRQLDKVFSETLKRAWLVGAGPGSSELVIDVDSTICEVCGTLKQGATYGYTGKLCYHPILATRSQTGEVLHARMRRGKANTQRGAVVFIQEVISRVRRAGATGQILMRFDSGFWSHKTIATLERLDIGYTMGVKMVKSIKDAVSSIEESAWMPIEYTRDGEAEVAECEYQQRRLIVRRTRLTGPPSSTVARMAPPWFCHRPRRRCRRCRFFPPKPRQGRARDKGPERRSRPRTCALWELQCQLRLALVCGPCSRSHQMDRHAR